MQQLQRRFNCTSNDIAKSLPVLCAVIDPQYSELSFLNETRNGKAEEELLNQVELQLFNC